MVFYYELLFHVKNTLEVLGFPCQGVTAVISSVLIIMQTLEKSACKAF